VRAWREALGGSLSSIPIRKTRFNERRANQTCLPFHWSSAGHPAALAGLSIGDSVLTINGAIPTVAFLGAIGPVGCY